jgi:hypothetical protein
MSLAAPLLALIAAIARPRPAADPAARLVELETENKRLRVALDGQLNWAKEAARRLSDANEQARRLEALEQECAVWRAREEAWRQTEGADQVRALEVQQGQRVVLQSGQFRPQNLALPQRAPWRNCVPSRADALMARWR